MLIAVSRGDRQAARGTFQSIFWLLNIVLPIVAVLSGGAIFIAGVGVPLNLSGMAERDASLALFLLVLNVICYQYFLLVCAGIRSENRPATESIWAATSRLCESVMYGCSAVLAPSIAIAAALGLAARIVFLVLAYGSLRRMSPWLAFGKADASKSEIARLAHPAFAYMLVPIGQAMLIQGPVVILGHVSDALTVVIFSTSRTLARVGTSVTNMFNNTFIAEYSAASGRGETGKINQLVRIQMAISVAVISVYAIALLACAELIMNLFTHGKVQIVEPFFLILTLSVAAEMLWTALFTPISALNRHKGVTYCLAALSSLAFAIAYAWAIPNGGLVGAAAVLLSVHTLMILVCVLVIAKLAFRGATYAR